jgi:hypothetical protein
VLLVLNGIVATLVSRSSAPKPGTIVLANTIIVIVLSRMYSPIMIAPGIAASLAMAMVLTPRFSVLSSPITIALLMSGAVVLPLLLEQQGAVSTTMSVSPAGVLFDAPAISGTEPTPTILVGALYVISLIVGATIAGSQMRARTLQAQKHLHLQAWQLRQLVPR